MRSFALLVCLVVTFAHTSTEAASYLKNDGSVVNPILFAQTSGAAGMVIAINKRAGQGRVAELSPHDLRRSFITHLLDAGADALSVQKLAGNANTQTTLRYDRRDEKAKRKAVDLLHVPFVAA